MSKEFKIGLLALVSSILLYAGFNFLKGSDFFSRTKRFYAVYQNVDGLTISSPIMVNGLSVGRVQNIEILQKEKNKLKVTLDVRSDLVLGEGAKAILGDAGLLGGKIITLETGNASKPLKGGETIPSDQQKGLLADMTAKADPIISKTDSILGQVNDLLKTLSKSKEDVSQMLTNFNDISSSVKTTLSQGEINQILRNFNQLSADLVVLEKKFQPIVSKMDNVMDKFTKVEIESTFKKANESVTNLNTILEKVNRGEGTLGALANSDSLYRNLNNVSNSLDKLFIDVRENPKRYVNISIFGKKEK